MARKEWTQLTEQERSTFVQALIRLKSSTAPFNYDYFVGTHVQFFSSTHAHRAASFLPWHREMLRRFEQSLGVEIPYWDWGLDQRNQATTSVRTGVFAPGFLGHGDFFGNKWVCVQSPDSGRVLRRGWSNTLPTAPQIQRIFGQGTFAAFTRTLEQAPFHDAIHVMIAGGPRDRGHMGGAGSPNDPVFYLHHCYIDKLWSDWQKQNPSTTTQRGQYWPLTSSGSDLGMDGVMRPWTVSVRSTLAFQPY